MDRNSSTTAAYTKYNTTNIFMYSREHLWRVRVRLETRELLGRRVPETRRVRVRGYAMYWAYPPFSIPDNISRNHQHRTGSPVAHTFKRWMLAFADCVRGYSCGSCINFSLSPRMVPILFFFGCCLLWVEQSSTVSFLRSSSSTIAVYCFTESSPLPLVCFLLGYLVFGLITHIYTCIYRFVLEGQLYY